MATILPSFERGPAMASQVKNTKKKKKKHRNLHLLMLFFSFSFADQNAPATVAAAWSAGMVPFLLLLLPIKKTLYFFYFLLTLFIHKAHVDVYFFPCYSCGDPQGLCIRGWFSF
jgi:hypothetical protein